MDDEERRRRQAEYDEWFVRAMDLYANDTRPTSVLAEELETTVAALHALASRSAVRRAEGVERRPPRPRRPKK
ncbi:hypothetical protein ACIBKY_51405 [Nonomuraea sp. NPDC050394]|uniref:hypothetical protein n=1 Tax=Nonomuraea sp. NPDC050394 TaxID=3364363 RepID=UPI0037B68102